MTTKNILGFFAALVLCAPSLAFAVWWNPFTWNTDSRIQPVRVDIPLNTNWTKDQILKVEELHTEIIVQREKAQKAYIPSVQKTANTPQVPPQAKTIESDILKIERCKAARELEYTNLEPVINQTIDLLLVKQQTDRDLYFKKYVTPVSGVIAPLISPQEKATFRTEKYATLRAELGKSVESNYIRCLK